MTSSDFNVHHTNWLNSTHTDEGGREAHSFAILHDLEQIIKHLLRVPDCHGHASNTLDLSFTANRLATLLLSLPHLVLLTNVSLQLPPLSPRPLPFYLLNAMSGTLGGSRDLISLTLLKTFHGRIIVSGTVVHTSLLQR